MRRTMLRLLLPLAGRGPCTGYDGGTCTVSWRSWPQTESMGISWRISSSRLEEPSTHAPAMFWPWLSSRLYLALRRVLLHCNTIHVMSTFAFIGQTDRDRLIVVCYREKSVHDHRLIFLTKLQHDNSWSPGVNALPTNPRNNWIKTVI